MDQSSDIYNFQLSGMCNDCMVLAAQATISDKNGVSLNIGSGVYTHHIIMTDRGRKPIPNPVAMKCGRFTLDGNMPMGNVSVFLGKGDELDGKVFAAKSETVKSGFHIGKTDRMNFAAEVVNYDDFDKDVYLRLEYEYITGRPSGYLDIGMGAINIGECGQSLRSLHPPKDKAVTFKSADWEVTHTGYLVNITPHLHDGGIDAKLFLNGTHVCTATAIYGGAAGGTAVGGEKWETITSYKDCTEPIHIRKGDKLSMTSEYDLTKHRLRPHSTNPKMGAEIMATQSYFFAMEA